MQKKKKGFTLVELLVVIAILAILAAVSVVGYLSFTEKAKESNDNTLVTQLNTVLQADEVNNGKPSLPSDAIKILENNGFVYEKLTPTSDENEFLYNIKTNRLELRKKSEVEEKLEANPFLWVIVQEESRLDKLSKTYSILLGSNYKDFDNKIIVSNGFDSNNTIGDYEVVYQTNGDAKEVIINTNGEMLIINGKNGIDGDTIYHYGTSNTVKVNSVGSNSYHEYGVINSLYFTEGRLVSEVNSSIDNLVVMSDSVEKKVKIDVNVGTVNNIAIDEKSNENVTITGYDTNKVLDAISVKNYEEFDNATWPASGNPFDYIILENDIKLETSISIKKNIVIDGNGHTITGHRKTYSASESSIKEYVTLCISSDGNDLPSDDYKVVLKNINIKNDSENKSNVIGVNSYVQELVLENVILYGGNGNNSSGIFVEKGLNQENNSLNLMLHNSKILCNNSSYGIQSYRAIDLNVDTSYINGFGSIYIRNFSKNSNIYIKDSILNNPNFHSGDLDNFGVITLESGFIDITIESTTINGIENAEAYQYIIFLSDRAANMSNVNVLIKGDTKAYGQLLKNCWNNAPDIDVKITGGIFNEKPDEKFIPRTHKLIMDGIFYKVVEN